MQRERDEEEPVRQDTEADEVLEGGNVNQVIRIGHTVRRQTGYWSPSVHELLIHLETQGFNGAPRFLGIDDSGREILTFIPGESPGNVYPELKPYMWSDKTLVCLAHLLRSCHDATHGLVYNAVDKWQLTYGDASKHEVICHNDAALYNVVFQDEYPVAFIDFDMAGPGPRMWDIAYSLYTSVPLTTFSPDYSLGTAVAYKSDLHAVDRQRRIHLFLEAYGIPVPNDLREWVLQRLTALWHTLRNGAEKGDPAFQKMVDEGHLRHYENELQFLGDHFEDWT